MASRMLINDLVKLQEKYKNKMEYFDKKIQSCTDSEEDKKFFKCYTYCANAYYEIRNLIATHERVYGNG